MTAGSPLGPLTLSGTEGALTGIAFGVIREGEERPSPVLEQAARELEKYFAGAMRAFTVPLSPEGTEFQKKVWEALCTIPYGETRSYGEIAAQIGNPKAYRAVGGANNKNPIMIFIPCHRVIGADGSLVGFGGGIDAKKFMLDLERKV